MMFLQLQPDSQNPHRNKITYFILFITQPFKQPKSWTLAIKQNMYILKHKMHTCILRSRNSILIFDKLILKVVN